MKRILNTAMILVSLIVAAGCSPAFGVTDIGQAIGNIKLTASDGKQIELNKIAAATVLAFWVPKSEDSRKGLDDLAAIMKDQKFKGVKILAVTRGKDEAEKKTAREEFAKYKLPFTLAFDSKLECSTHFKVKPPLPAFYLLGADHKAKALGVRKLKGRIRNLSFSDMVAAVSKGGSIPRVDFEEVDDHELANRKLVGSFPPNFSVKDMRGRSYNPRMYKGRKNLILVFWNPGCPHCRRELPRLKQFINSYGLKYNVEVLALTSGSGKEFKQEVTGAISDLSLDFPVAIFDNKTIIKQYSATSVPLTYIINKNGVVCESLAGEHEDAPAVLLSVFQDNSRMSMK